MPSFSDSIVLFILALLLFGPKKLPVLARELGKWVGEFRRASNEFKMQMEEELRLSEQEDRTKQIAAMEAAAPLPALPAEPEEVHPHLRYAESATLDGGGSAQFVGEAVEGAEDLLSEPARAVSAEVVPAEPHPAEPPRAEPLPIATSGDLRMMPPATGLPLPRGRTLAAAAPEEASANGPHALDSFVSSIPRDEATNGNGRSHTLVNAGEGAAH